MSQIALVDNIDNLIYSLNKNFPDYYTSYSKQNNSPHNLNLKNSNRKSDPKSRSVKPKSVETPVILPSVPPGFEHLNNSAVQTGLQKSANADTGASGSYIATRDVDCLYNLKPCTASTQISVKVASGNIIMSSHIGELRIPDGSTLTAYVFPGISDSLLSISQFVDIGFTVIYSADDVKFIKK